MRGFLGPRNSDDELVFFSRATALATWLHQTTTAVNILAKNPGGLELTPIQFPGEKVTSVTKGTEPKSVGKMIKLRHLKSFFCRKF